MSKFMVIGNDFYGVNGFTSNEPTIPSVVSHSVVVDVSDPEQERNEKITLLYYALVKNKNSVIYRYMPSVEELVKLDARCESFLEGLEGVSNTFYSNTLEEFDDVKSFTEDYDTDFVNNVFEYAFMKYSGQMVFFMDAKFV